MSIRLARCEECKVCSINFSLPCIPFWDISIIWANILEAMQIQQEG